MEVVITEEGEGSPGARAGAVDAELREGRGEDVGVDRPVTVRTVMVVAIDRAGDGAVVRRSE